MDLAVQSGSAGPALPDRDQMVVIWEGGWTSYEEHDVVEILEDLSGQLWLCRSFHHVMGDGPCEEFRPLPWSEVLEVMEEHGEYECLVAM